MLLFCPKQMLETQHFLGELFFLALLKSCFSQPVVCGLFSLFTQVNS